MSLRTGGEYSVGLIGQWSDSLKHVIPISAHDARTPGIAGNQVGTYGLRYI